MLGKCYVFSRGGSVKGIVVLSFDGVDMILCSISNFDALVERCNQSEHSGRLSLFVEDQNEKMGFGFVLLEDLPFRNGKNPFERKDDGKGQ